MRPLWTTTITAALLAIILGCSADDADRSRLGETDPAAEIPAHVQAQLDSGTAAFRAGDIDGANSHYRRATELGPDIAAGWYGVFMAERALGNEAAADSARLEAHRRAPSAALDHPVDQPSPTEDPGP